MTPLGIWLRRGVGKYLAIVLFGFISFSLLTQPDWRVEYDWASRLVAANVLVTCPGLAAGAAFDTARRFRPTLSLLSRGSPRSAGHILLPAAAVVLWAFSAYVMTWAGAFAIVISRGGVGVTDWWVFPEVAAPLAAAGGVGLLVGMVVRNQLAAPVAAVAPIALTLAASPWGRGPFEAVTTYGTLTGLERAPLRAVASLSGAVIVGGAAVLMSMALDIHRRFPRRFTVSLLAIVMGLGSVGPAAWPWQQQVYIPTTEAYGCIGFRPSVCAPRSRLELVRPVQASLSDAYVRLAGTDFTRPDAFRVTRMGHYAALNGAAPLDFDPAYVRGDRYDINATAKILLRPHECRALFDARTASAVLDAQDRVLPWLTAALRGRTAATPVPAAVASSFATIANCERMTGNLN